MQERLRFERELADLGSRQYQVPPPLPPATIGFEFDVHYGLIKEVVEAPGRGLTMPFGLITKHTWPADGFEVKKDGPRLEIATKPFELTTAGKRDIDDTVKKIMKFAGELEAGCKSAPEQSIAVPGVSGKPRPFTHPSTLVTDLPLVKLQFDRKFPRSDCRVWASPQATITIPLSKVGALVEAIHTTEKEAKGPGFQWTGGPGTRMGVRSLAVYNAKAAVDKVWHQLVTASPKIKLSDGTTEVNRTTFTDTLRGFLILLASYLWTGQLKYRFPASGTAAKKGEDYETLDKAYLPLNVKAPFSQIFRELLTDTERRIFRELFGEGDARKRMFRLVKKDAELTDGTKNVFPRNLGFVTWNDLLARTLDPADNSLVVSASKMIEVSKTKPRVAIELRRIGWNLVFATRWPEMIKLLVAMTERLNA